MSYHGDIKLGDTIDIQFTTVDDTGAPTALSGSPSVAAYIGNSTTEITAGITLTASLDSRTGLNNVRVVATGANGYSAATNVSLVVTAGTVDGQSIVGYQIGSFSIDNRNTTANLTQIDGDGDAMQGLFAMAMHYFSFEHLNTERNLLSTGIDTVNSQTEFVLDAGVAVDDIYNGMLGVIQSPNPIEKHQFRVVDWVGSTKTLTIDTAAPFTVDVTGYEINILASEEQVLALPHQIAGAAGGVFIAGTNAATAVTTSFTTTFTGNLTGSVGSVTGAVGSVTGNVGGNVTGSVGSVVGAVGSVTGNVGGNVAGSVGSVTGNVGGNVVGSVGSLTGFTVDGSGLTSIPWNASWDAEVQSEVNDGLVAFWTSPATLVDLVWDELLSGHTVSGSTGEALAAAGTAGDPWTTSLPGSYTGDQAGKILADILVDTGTTLDGKLDTIDGIVDDILVDTGTTIPGTIATAQADLDILTGTDGATLAASQPNYAPAKVSDLGTVQTADHTAAIAALPTLSQILAGGDIDGYTLEETLKLCLAALAGKLDGAATTTITIRSADDSANRITATVDADGNRSAVTLDATG
jgi:hypothetical protein